MYIPNEIKVKIESRKGENTPTGFVTYIDENGKLRKSTSWSKWGDKDLGVLANAPLRGFKLERAVTRSRDWFGSGRTLFRIIHPNNFVFEISANNFQEIILSCNLIMGEIDDACVLAWNGENIALIPCSSSEYSEIVNNSKQIDAGAVKPSDLIVGNYYNSRNSSPVGYYIGRFYTIRLSIIDVDSYGHQVEGWRGRGRIERHIAKLKIRRIHIFEKNHAYYDLATPKVFEDQTLSPKFIPKGFIPNMRYYEDQVISEELANGSSADIIKWAQDNNAIMQRCMGYEKLIKFEVAGK